MIRDGIKLLKEGIKTGINNPTTMKELIEKLQSAIKSLDYCASIRIDSEHWNVDLTKAELNILLSSLQSKGKTDKSKLNDRDREMEGDLSVLIGSEIAIINKGTKQEIDWQMISEWLVKKIGPKLESKGKTKEEVLRKVFPQDEESGFKWPDAYDKTTIKFVEKAMEEYVQSHANKDGCKAIPYQCCPVCNGSGQMYEPISSGTFRACPTCEGARIIPMYANQQPEAMKEGWVSVEAAQRLLAIRDALIQDDIESAYHELRMLADSNTERNNHWENWEKIATPPQK